MNDAKGKKSTKDLDMASLRPCNVKLNINFIDSATALIIRCQDLVILLSSNRRRR